jgi:hypothetical protein
MGAWGANSKVGQALVDFLIQARASTAGSRSAGPAQLIEALTALRRRLRRVKTMPEGLAAGLDTIEASLAAIRAD